MMLEIHPKTKKEWKDWLEKNHEKEKKVFLIKYKKHTGKPTITNSEAMDEAICFGWIDTTIKRIDHEKYGQTFVKRTEKGRWSNNTIKYAKQLIKEGRMTKAGLKMYKHGLKKPTLDHNLPKNPKTPDDLKQELKKQDALSSYNKMAPSYRKPYIYYVMRCKLPETRKKRIKQVVARVKLGKKFGEK